LSFAAEKHIIKQLALPQHFASDLFSRSVSLSLVWSALMPATVLNTFIRLVDQLWWGPWPGQQVKEALEGHLPLVFYVRKYTNKNIIKVDVTIYYLKGILCADIDCILGKNVVYEVCLGN